MRHVKHLMGMPIVAEIPRCKDGQVFDAVFNRFHEIDQRFSPFIADSELSKYQKGTLKKNDLSPEFGNVIKACERARTETKGYFSADYSSKFDPTGYVKGWAIAEAGRLVEKLGYKTYCISAGGDILARSNSDKIWNIGIQNPTDSTKILNKLSISNGAIATSGNYERGSHIYNPKTGKPANEFLSVTIMGSDIIEADIFATAVFAAGVPGLVMLEENSECEAFGVTADGDYYMTSEADKYLAVSGEVINFDLAR